jgi:hypothetical protein
LPAPPCRTADAVVAAVPAQREALGRADVQHGAAVVRDPQTEAVRFDKEVVVAIGPVQDDRVAVPLAVDEVVAAASRPHDLIGAGAAEDDVIAGAARDGVGAGPAFQLRGLGDAAKALVEDDLIVATVAEHTNGDDARSQEGANHGRTAEHLDARGVPRGQAQRDRVARGVALHQQFEVDDRRANGRLCARRREDQRSEREDER